MKNDKLIKIIVLAVGVLFILCAIIMSFNQPKNISSDVIDFDLKGENIIYLNIGSKYNEPGYYAKINKTDDVSDDVVVNNNIDVNKPGRYEIIYRLEHKGTVYARKRIIYVRSNGLNNDSDNEFISSNDLTIKLNGRKEVYLLEGSKYKEQGAKAYFKKNKDISNKIDIKSNVNSNNAGKYQVKYTVNYKDKNISIVRDVTVFKIHAKSSYSTYNYTNSDININFKVDCDNFDYLILPDGKKVNSPEYNYKVTKNGYYSFSVYNKFKLGRKFTYSVKNIDKDSPNGSCSGTTNGNSSNIIVKAFDNIGINKYVFNGKSYGSGNINVNYGITNPEIIIYDNAGNSKKITCSLKKDSSGPNNNEPIKPPNRPKPTVTPKPSPKPNIPSAVPYKPSGRDITMSYKYVDQSDTMSYGLFTPSTAKNNTPIPVIVWLHGSGEVMGGSTKFSNSGLPKILKNWSLDGINAYVICPHICAPKYGGGWYNDKNRNYIKILLNKFFASHNVDKSRIVIMGHSLGGQGALFMGQRDYSLYSAMIVFSGYHPIVNMDGIGNKLPTMGYVGTVGGGEDPASYNYMTGLFKKQFGENHLRILNTSHGNLPYVALTADSNNDHKSDLIEWALTQHK